MEKEQPVPVLEREYPLLLNDIGPDAALRSWHYFDFLQDIAARHAEMLGVGMSRLRELGIIWVLSRMRLKIEEHPLFGDTLCVRTWPSGFRKLFATRQYEVRSKLTGRVLACGSSFWLTLDAASLRPVPPARMVNGLLPENQDKPFFFENPGKIAAADGSDEMVPHTAWQSVIDYNDHLNNAVYVRYIQDLLASKRGAPVRLREIGINYNHAVKFGEVLLCGGTLSDDGQFRVSGSLQSGNNVFCAEGSIF